MTAGVSAVAAAVAAAAAAAAAASLAFRSCQATRLTPSSPATNSTVLSCSITKTGNTIQRNPCRQIVSHNSCQEYVLLALSTGHRAPYAA